MADTINFSGREVGRYRLLSLLGTGGMGAVYEAIDPLLGRHVAVKILSPHLLADPRRISRFVQEARTASALNHPHLISIYDIGRQQIDGLEIQFIAMEKVDGSDLRSILSVGPLLLPRAVELMLQITEAVAAAHAAGVVHRDLKPENVMISHAGYPKVLDFGLAKLLGDPAFSAEPNETTAIKSTQTGAILGTAGYMSPEQAQGRSTDHRGDIFSLGCILYEAVTGRRAFRGASAIDTLHAIIHAELEPMDGVNAPEELQRIVWKALAKDPEQRYQTAKDMAIDLRELLRLIERRPLRQKRRTRTMARYAGLVAAIVIVATAFLLWRQRTARASPPEPELRRVPLTGNINSASISPDGKLLCYTVWDESGPALRLRQLVTGQDLQLFPPGRVGILGHTFTPDGNAIVYVAKSGYDPDGALYRVSTIGGPSKRVLSGIDSPVSFSPDGRQMTYIRAVSSRTKESALVVANSDGSGVYTIATRQPPERFALFAFKGPSWSSDGKIIAACTRQDGSMRAKLIGVDPQTGAEMFLTQRWRFVAPCAWLPDMSGIIVTASDETSQPKLWLLPYPHGTPRCLTNDGRQYVSPSVSADGKSLVAIAGITVMEMWSRPFEHGEPQRIRNTHRLDASAGVSFVPDGHLVFTSRSSEKDPQDLSIANADGSGRALLLHDGYDNRYPVAFEHGIVFLSTTPSKNEICAFNFEGLHQRRVIVGGVDAAPIAVTRDGKWIAYTLNNQLWRIGIDGRNAKRLTEKTSRLPSWSPSGDRIAFHSVVDNRLVVMPADGGTVIWSTPARTREGSAVRWLPDGSGLLVNDGNYDRYDDRSNLWRVPFQGAQERLTNFRDQRAYAFDLSPDAKTLVLVRARPKNDAVLLTNFR
jgi:eukaryotic-like serine/threonine-protein kinase